MSHVRLYGTYLTANGLPSVGFIRITPRVIAPVTGAALPADAKTVLLNVAGYVEAVVSATDELIGVKWIYEVQENIDGNLRSYEVIAPVQLSVELGQPGIDLVASYPPVTGGSGGAVQSVEGRTGNVILSDLYQLSTPSLGFLSSVDVTSYGSALISKNDSASTRSFLGLGSAATSSSGSFDPIGAAATVQAVSQPLDEALTALSGVNSAANKIPYFTGSGTAATTDLTAFTRQILAATTSGDVRNTLGLGSAALRDVGGANGLVALDGDQKIPLQFIPDGISGGGGAVDSVDGRVGNVTLTDIYQPLDSSLNSLSGIPITSFGISLLDQTDVSSTRSTLGLVPGVDLQPYSATLDAVGNLSVAPNTFSYYDGSSNLSLSGLTDFGRNLINSSNVNLARSTLGLGSAATSQSADFDPAGTAASVQAASQPLDQELTALAFTVSAANKLPYYSGVGTALTADFTPFARTILDDPDVTTVRTTLGLVIGTDVQAQDAELQALAGLISSSNQIPYFTGSGTAALTALSPYGRSLVDDPDSITARGTLGLTIGTDVQAQDVELQALSGLTSAANKLPYFTGSGTAATTDLTAFVRSLLDDTDAATFRTTLGLGTAATLNTGGPNGLPQLDGTAKIPTSYLPSFATSSSYVVASQTEMLALSGAAVGDVAIRTDLSERYILTATPASTLSNWLLLDGGSGGGAVDSVDGRIGVVVLSDLYQPLSSGLTSLSGVSSTTFGRSFLTQTDANSTKSILGLVVGTNVQAQDPELQALSGLTSAEDTFPYFTGSGMAALGTVTSFARTFLTSSDASSARINIGLASLVTSVNGQSGNVNFEGIYQQADEQLDMIAEVDVATYGANLLTLTSTSGLRTLIGLDGAAFVPTSAFDPAGAASTAQAAAIAASQPLDLELLALAGLSSAANKLPYFTGVGTAGLVDFSAFARTLLDDPNAAAARNTLQLVPGTDVQTQDAELQAIAGLSSTADTFPYFTGSGTASLGTVTSFARTILDDADQSTVQATLGLVPGTNVQAYSSGLGALSSLTSATDELPYFTGIGTADTTTLTGFARTILDDPDQGTVQATLGLVPGTNVQAQDAELQALAGLTSTSDTFPYFTGSGTASLSGVTTFGRSLVDDLDASTARNTLGVVIGTNVQAQDQELQAIAGLTSAVDKLPYFTGSGTADLANFTTFGRALVDDTDASAARTTLGLGQAATRDVGGTTGLVALVGGLVPTAYLPAAAGLHTFSVASQAAMLALSSADIGDIAIRTDESKRYVLSAADPTVLSNWLEIDDTGAVDSVDGRTGNVVLSDLYQPLDSDLTSLAAATTSSFGISLLGQANAGATRTTLGLVPGTDVQVQDAELSALAGLTSAANKLPYFTGSGTAALADLSVFSRTFLDDPDAATVRTTLGLVIGTNVQAQDLELSALASTTSAANKLPYFTGSGTAFTADFTAFARTLIDDVDAPTARTTLGLGTAAILNAGGATGVVQLSGGLIPTSYLPGYPQTTTSIYTVASQTAMLALSAIKGDFAIRNDQNITYVLSALPASTLGNWKALPNGGSGTVPSYTGPADGSVIVGDACYITAADKIARASAAPGGNAALGYVLLSADNGQTTTIYFEGWLTGLSGLTPGTHYFLSDTTPGGFTVNPAIGSGKIHQYLGSAITTTTILWAGNPDEAVIRA